MTPLARNACAGGLLRQSRVRGGAALGDLLVELQVAVPEHLSKIAQGHLEKLMAALPKENPREDLLKRAGV